MLQVFKQHVEGFHSLNSQILHFFSYNLYVNLSAAHLDIKLWYINLNQWWMSWLILSDWLSVLAIVCNLNKISLELRSRDVTQEEFTSNNIAILRQVWLHLKTVKQQKIWLCLLSEIIKSFQEHVCMYFSVRTAH